jgi:hypothetical protein
MGTPGKLSVRRKQEIIPEGVTVGTFYKLPGPGYGPALTIHVSPDHGVCKGLEVKVEKQDCRFDFSQTITKADTLQVTGIVAISRR